MTVLKIAFVPIDNRPVCYTLAQQIAEIDKNLELFLPPRDMLGDLTKTADIDGIIVWLQKLDKVDKIVVSLDTVAYGGLIPSRRSEDTFEQIEERMKKFKSILLQNSAKVYAFSSIMRISNNNINEEEKEYWNLYGTKIFQYSYNVHKNAPETQVETDVPLEILQDYLKTRKRNFDVNMMYLEWAKEGVFDTLVFSKDDCAQYGLNVAEAQALQQCIKENNLKALVKTGADEIPLSLLCRAIAEGREIKIFPAFTQSGFVDRISKYEDVTVYDSVRGQIELAGANIVNSENEADIVLVINNFKEEQGELVMGVDVEGFAGKLELPEKPYIIADILNANGADNNFVEQFLHSEINWDKFLGYAGWNTTGNTLGSVLCCAIVKYLAQRVDLEAFKKVQAVRFLDDWAYQANVRKKLKSVLKEPDTDRLKSEMQNFETVLGSKFKMDLKNTSYSYPWHRFFEVEITL